MSWLDIKGLKWKKNNNNILFRAMKVNLGIKRLKLILIKINPIYDEIIKWLDGIHSIHIYILYFCV